ncbi:MAG TPA: zinc-binding dehydrogenase [Sedimentisphaerales bacterium]|jgi:NADPH:quinone reductase-like Zn-dependent oxidoreductase|nr:zinc-binding dehydrogenase [Sedimentisphaerales bacterium]HNU30679.1 zinc-binding dehydrogenase [Sedimentisphaerales bacterium]
MKAAAISGFGGSDVLHVMDVKEPATAPGEVVLRILCAGLNHLDIWVRKGRPGSQLAMPHVLGSDAVGVVAAVGEGVTEPEIGDVVILYPGLICGRCEFCRRGEQSLCVDFGIVGLVRPGTFAERVAVPAGNCYPKPAHLGDEEAGVLSLAHVTAWRMLMTRAQIKPGETLLIHGIGGGVAIAALQFAKMTGAEVLVTSSSDEKLSRARQLGADHTIHYGRQNVAEQVSEITSGRGVDVVLDTVGAATWPLDSACVRKGGRIVLCGVTTGAKAETDLRCFYWNQLNAMGSTLGSAEDFRQMLRAVTVNKLRPVVDTVLPLDNACEAMDRMETAGQFGKIALRVSK